MKTLKEQIKALVGAVTYWFASNGFTGIAGLIAGLILFTLGHKFWAGISLGVFFTRNWDIITA